MIEENRGGRKSKRKRCVRPRLIGRNSGRDRTDSGSLGQRNKALNLLIEPQSEHKEIIWH